MVGLAVLAPAGMLAELSQGLGVTVRDAGFLITYGAVNLCLGSPIVSWLTTRIDRRTLLTVTLAIMALGHIASAFADSYFTILLVRLTMLVFVAIYTPQATSTIALIVPEKSRSSAISFVFLGWSLAIAVGLPFITLLATHFGWRETYFAIGILAGACALLNFLALPRGLRGNPTSLQSFASIARNRILVLVLLITLLLTCGHFAVVVYLAPLLAKLAGASAAVGGLFFALLGGAAVAGNIAAAGIVTWLGLQRTLAAFMLFMILGTTLWSAGAGSLVAMGAGIVIWGLGFTAVNSMQQARLVDAAPMLASASVALNTSVLYVGQALGSATGGWLYANEFYRTTGFVAAGFFVIAFATFALTWERRKVLIR